MMEATQQGQGDDVALFGWFHGTRFRSVLVQRSVRAVLMIIVEVVRESAPQMGLVEHDHVMQTFPADGADQAFDKRILPGERGAMNFCSSPSPRVRCTNSKP